MTPTVWIACPKCQALCPQGARFCPNCAPRGTAWQRWFRGLVGAAGLAVLGGASACCETSVLEVEQDGGVWDAGANDGGPDAGLDAGSMDAGLDGGATDAGPMDAGLQDAGVVKCFCPIGADYGAFGPCEGDPADPDGGCPGGFDPTCMICP
jgi:hypothetical protein